MFPYEITAITSNLPYTADNIGRSEDTVYIFEKTYVLKVSKDGEMLTRERERFDFLSDNGIPGPRSICFVNESDKYFYLRTYLNGESLIAPRFINNPELLVEALASTVAVLRSLDGIPCPFLSSDNEGNDFVHGDLCLPNIYANPDGSFAGFIDLGNAGLGDSRYDYAWMLWSLEYNLGTDKYNGTLLEKIGVEFDREWFERYIPEEYRGMRL